MIYWGMSICLELTMILVDIYCSNYYSFTLLYIVGELVLISGLCIVFNVKGAVSAVYDWD